MSESEIHFIVTNAAENMHDTEQILSAIGEYQNTLAPHIIHTATIAEGAEDTVTLTLIRKSLEQRPRYEHLEEAEKMQKGVKAHFSEEQRARLSRYFAGIVTPGALETE